MASRNGGRDDTSLERVFSVHGAVDVAWTRYQAHRPRVWKIALHLRLVRAALLVVPLGLYFLLAPELGDTAATILTLPLFAVGLADLPAETALWLLVARDEEPSTDAVFGTLRRLPAMAVVGLVNHLLWLLAWLPGVYVSLRFRLARHLVVDRGMGPIEALKESLRLTAGQTWRLILVDIHENIRNQGRAGLIDPAGRIDVRFAGHVADAVAYLYLSGQATEDLLAYLDPRIEPAPGQEPRPRRKKKRKKPAGAPAFACPRCRGDVFERRGEGHRVHRCAGCGGVWVDNATSKIVVGMVDEGLLKSADVAAAEAESPVADERPLLSCPTCHERLARVNAAGVHVDFCAAHGTWFDRGELQRVSRAMELERVAKEHPLRDPTAGETLARGVEAMGGGVARSVFALLLTDDD